MQRHIYVIPGGRFSHGAVVVCHQRLHHPACADIVVTLTEWDQPRFLMTDLWALSDGLAF